MGLNFYYLRKITNNLIYLILFEGLFVMFLMFIGRFVLFWAVYDRRSFLATFGIAGAMALSKTCKENSPHCIDHHWQFAQCIICWALGLLCWFYGTKVARQHQAPDWILRCCTFWCWWHVSNGWMGMAWLKLVSHGTMKVPMGAYLLQN